MAPSADLGVSTRSRAPTPSGGESFSRSARPSRLARRGGGDAAGEPGRRTPPLKAEAVCPTCAGLDQRAEPPPRAGGEAGAGLEVEERWERGCADDSPLSWQGGCWGRPGGQPFGEGGTGAARGAEQVRKDVLGVFGSHPAGLSSEPGKLLASTSGSSPTTLLGWGRAPGSLCFFPGGSRAPRHSAPWPRAPGASPASSVAASCLCWTEVWSPRSQPVSGKPASGIPGGNGGLPRPLGAHGGFDGAAGQTWGHAQQCSSLLRSTYSSWEPWLVPFLQKPTQESKVIPAWMGASQSGRERLLGLEGGGGTPLPQGMTNEYCWRLWWSVHLVWLLCVPGGASALQAGHVLESHLRCLLGWVQDFPSEAGWKRRGKGSKNGGQLCSAALNLGNSRGETNAADGRFFLP